MDRTFKRVELFVLCCLVSLVKSHTDLKPRNVNVTFVNDFCLKASWDPPEGIDGIQGCDYEYFKIPKIEFREEYVKDTYTILYTMIEGGTTQFSLQTMCNGIRKGDPVVVDITTNPELVSDFQCALHSPTDANCSWTPSNSSQVSNLRLFYWIGSTDPGCGPVSLKECVILPHPDNVKRVCHISEDSLYKEIVYFLFNGTQDNMFVRNTFNKQMHHNVRPPALKWELIRDGDNLRVNWTPPDIFKDSWEYLINYTECGIRKNKTILKGATSWVIESFAPHCQYRMKMIAKMSEGETPWTVEKSYGDNVSRHVPMIIAAAISPLLVALISFLAFCVVRKYKDEIFPKVPEPKNLLKDMLDNNNKCPAEKLYVPVEETEETKICLVLEPQVTNLDAEIP